MKKNVDRLDSHFEEISVSDSEKINDHALYMEHTFYDDLFILSRISALWKSSEPFKKESGKNGNALAVL